jgi:predicted GIY-YIG superfamily endonuclease
MTLVDPKCISLTTALATLVTTWFTLADVDEGLDTATLTSVSLMLLGRRNATTGGSGNNLQEFHSKTTGKEHKIFGNVNCKTPNVVYLLDCHVCGSQYVGESVQPFNRRMNRHRSDLTKKTLLPVSEHVVSPLHSLDDLGRSKIYIIDHNPSLKENQRQKRESFWIRELRLFRKVTSVSIHSSVEWLDTFFKYCFYQVEHTIDKCYNEP